MPAWRGRLSQEEIRSVVTYIGTLSELGADDTEPSPALELAGPAQTELKLNSANNPASDQKLRSGEGRPSGLMGDPAKGKELFFDISDNMNCAACHRINGKGSGVGPDLSHLSERSPKEIFKDIILPNADVPQAGQLVELTTHDGEWLEVLRVEESSSRVKVYDVSSSPPVLRSIKKEQIRSLRASDRSAMPETYAQRYTLLELLDLISFLKTPKSGPAADVALTDIF